MSLDTELGQRLAVVIVVDGLRASALGAYGNTTVPTPLFDEFASRSLVVEWLLANRPTLSDFYLQALAGIEALSAHRRLITDDTSILAAGSNPFAEVMTIAPGAARSAADLEATHAASFFTQAVEQLAAWRKEAEERQTSGLLWLHFSGLTGPWDAPLEMRSDLLDDDDPPAPGFVNPPSDLRGVADPDELLGYRVAYAAQVSVIETCLAGLAEAFDELSFPGKKLTMICGARGFALGEHGCLGHDCQSLYSEQLHLPWLIKAGQTPAPLPRATGFAQPQDTGATLAHWLSQDSAVVQAGRSLVPLLDAEPGRLREAIVASNAAGESMIRSSAWSMKRGATTELFAKPDDRWEVNDVASRCPEIVELLEKQLQTLQSGGAVTLNEVLMSPWR